MSDLLARLRSAHHGPVIAGNHEAARGKLSTDEQVVVDGLARAFARANRSVTAAELSGEIARVETTVPDVSQVLDQLHPVFIDDLPGSLSRTYEPTLEGWLAATRLGAHAKLSIQAALLVLRGKAELGHRPANYTWAEMVAVAGLSSADLPIAARVLSLVDLQMGGGGPQWEPSSTKQPEWTFTAPSEEFDAIVRYEDAGDFIEYRRREPREFRAMRRRWTNELDLSKQFAIRTIYEAFDKTAKWPSAHEVEVQLRRANRRSLTELAPGSRLIRAGNPHDPKSRASLTLEGLYLARGEEDCLAITRLLSGLGRLGPSSKGSRSLSIEELPASLEFDDVDLRRLGEILDVQSEVFVTSISEDVGTMRFEVTPRTIQYAEAKRFEDILLADDRAGRIAFETMSLAGSDNSGDAASLVTDGPPSVTEETLHLGPKPRVIKFLGSGAEADVYLVVDRFKREVAAKVFYESKRIPEHIYGHAVGLARVPHPAVAELYSIEEVIDLEGKPVPAILMERLVGEELEIRLQREVSVHELVAWGRTLLDVFAAMHAVDHFHPDPHPGNFFVTDRGLRVYDVLNSLTAENRSPRTKEAMRSDNARRVRGMIEAIFDKLPISEGTQAASKLFSSKTRNVKISLEDIRTAFGEAIESLKDAST